MASQGGGESVPSFAQIVEQFGQRESQEQKKVGQMKNQDSAYLLLAIQKLGRPLTRENYLIAEEKKPEVTVRMAVAQEFKRLPKSEIGDELTTPTYQSDFNDL